MQVGQALAQSGICACRMGLPEERRPRDRPPGGPASLPLAAAALVATTALLVSFGRVGASSGEAALAFISYLLAPCAGVGSGGLGVGGGGRDLAFISSLFSPSSVVPPQVSLLI